MYLSTSKQFDKHLEYMLLLHYVAGTELKDNKLRITENMVGVNQWSCVAENLIDGKLYQTSIEVNFKAGKCIK